MQGLFCAAGGLLAVFFLVRRFDLFTIVFYASLIYFLPAYFGYTVYDYRDPTPFPINTTVYIFYTAFYLLLALFATTASVAGTVPARGRYQEMFPSERNYLNRIVLALRIIAPALLLAAVWLTPGGVFQDNKQDLLDSISPVYAVFQSAALIYVVVAIVCRRRVDIVFSAALCAFDLLVGFRTVATFAMLSLIAYYGLRPRSRKHAVRFNFAALMTLVAAYFVGSTYKSAIFAFLTGDLDGLVTYYTSPAALAESLQFTEAFSQQDILNRTVATDFSVPYDYAFGISRVLFPGLANHLFGANVSFNDLFQPKLYPEIPWGMASNVWAEQYAIGGFGWLFGFTILFFLLLLLLNRSLLSLSRMRRTAGLLFAIVVLVPALFYMHRNDLAYQLVLARNVGLFLLLLHGLSMLRLTGRRNVTLAAS